MTKFASKDVAAWMAKKVRDSRELYQDEAAFEIQQTFGEPHVYVNENGNLAISREVLSAFRKMTEEKVVWVRSDRMWRLREEYDEKGKRGVD